MDQLSQIEIVRRVVLSTLTELGMPRGDGALVKETVLLRDRLNAGRRFQYDGLRAVWFGDLTTINFFSDDGQFLKSVSLDADSVGKQAAA